MIYVAKVLYFFDIHKNGFNKGTFVMTIGKLYNSVLCELGLSILSIDVDRLRQDFIN